MRLVRESDWKIRITTESTKVFATLYGVGNYMMIRFSNSKHFSFAILEFICYDDFTIDNLSNFLDKGVFKTSSFGLSIPYADFKVDEFAMAGFPFFEVFKFMKDYKLESTS